MRGLGMFGRMPLTFSPPRLLRGGPQDILGCLCHVLLGEGPQVAGEARDCLVSVDDKILVAVRLASVALLDQIPGNQ